MTVSICVRERYTTDDGTTERRYGVAVTASVPGVGAMSPVASADGAVATQGVVNERLGRDAVDALADGDALESVLETLLRADPDADRRQVHGVDADGTFAFTGEACNDWCGHCEAGQYTVAGTHLTGEAVLDAVADAYERAAPEPGASSADPLAGRLVDALAAGRRAGGDRRDDLPVRSAALVVARTEELTPTPYYEDLRVDASETPIRDLRETYEQARRGYRRVLQKYAADGDDEAAAGRPDGASAGRVAADDGSAAGRDGTGGRVGGDGRDGGGPAGLDPDDLAEFVDATAPDALAESIRPADILTGTAPVDGRRRTTESDPTDDATVDEATDDATVDEATDDATAGEATDDATVDEATDDATVDEATGETADRRAGDER